jgi:hypothetical protein
MADADRTAALEMLARLGRSSLGRRLVLAGSSGLFAASESIPALTEDLDLLVDADWLAGAEGEVVDELARHGLRHQPGTCTFVAADGSSLDLVGYSDRDRTDRIGGGERVRVMVFADLSHLLTSPDAVVELPGGGYALSAAALAASKLLTVRVEKGGKDKLQALLLVAENAGDSAFLAALRRYLMGFEADRIQDAVADAQAALLGLEVDLERTDPQARGYQHASREAARGLAILSKLMATIKQAP